MGERPITLPTRRRWSKYHSGELFSKSLLPLKKYTTFEFSKFTVKYQGFPKNFESEIYRKIHRIFKNF